MNEGGDAEPVIDVGIDIGGDFVARGADGFDLRDGLGHFAPVLLTGGLEVEDVDGRFGHLPDFDSFIDGIEQAIAFVAHVGVVASAVPAGDFRERGDLFQRGVVGGGIDEGGGDADRAGLHRLVDIGLHFFQFLRRRRAVDVAENEAPDLGVSDGLRDVDGEPLDLEEGEVLPHGGPALRGRIGLGEGAADDPSPALMVVMPWDRRLMAVLVSRSMGVAVWPIMSMNPGATMRPVASIVLSA